MAKKRLSANEIELYRQLLKDLAIEDLVAVLPATVVHENYPKRRKAGTSKTVLAGIAFDDTRLYSVTEKGMVHVPAADCSEQTAHKFVMRMRQWLTDIRNYADGQGGSSRPHARL